MDALNHTPPAPPATLNLEEKFINLLSNPAAPVLELLAALRALAEAAGPAKADACAELWQAELIDRRQTAPLLDLLRLRADWHPDDNFSGACAGLLSDYFRADAGQQALVDNAGFDQPGVPAAEALRRLDVLRGLRPGVICYDKTWGPGCIREISEYHRQVTVDFTRKPGHRLALAHAAANLMLLPPDSILARHYADPADAHRRMEEDSAGAAREILQSFGPFTVVRLQEWMTTHLLPAAGWKRFWDAARKKLKEDPLISLPARRNDPIVIRAREQTNDPQWLAAFRRENDFEKIFQGVEEIRGRAEPPAAEITALLADRLGFILGAAGKREQVMRARALLALEELGATPAAAGLAEAAAALLAPDIFSDTLPRLPVRSQAPFCRCLHRLQPELFRQILPAVLRAADAGALNEIWRALEADGENARGAEILRELLQAPAPSLELTAWLCRNPGIRDQYALMTPDRLAFAVINLLENPAMAGVGRTRARNQLRDSLADPDWLAAALVAMDPQQRRDFALRLKTANLGADINNAALLLQTVKLRPELEEALREAAPPPAAARLTARRSYRSRQAQLHKLITEEIPANSREIGVARGYGDLRENFEYKSAKDTQGLLMRRRMEWERMLAEVRPTDFANFPSDRAGPGTGVTLRYDDGREEQFHILGEWDHDDQLAIIPNRSRLAEILQGRRPGERVEVPDGDGRMRGATLAAVAGLSDAVRAWINAEP